MGCTSSIVKRCAVGGRKKLSVPEVVIFVPMMRIPMEVDLMRPLRGIVSRGFAERLVALRNRIVLLAEGTGGSAILELQQALEDYLPVLLGLMKNVQHLEEMVEFIWKNPQDHRQKACIASSWFELLSVVHMMAMLLLSEANLMLIPKDSMNACERKVSEDSKKDAIDLLLKASGYLEYCVRSIVVHMPPGIKMRLPRDLQEGVLEAISNQALAQVTEMQLGLAVENQKATLSVKRRLACEQVSYFAQAHYCLSGCITVGYGKKHLLFIKWKYLEAKAAAYYYHGLILDKGNESSDCISSVCCLLAADELLIDSKKTCLSFCLAVPVTRAPPAWGAMKHLHQKIPEVASRKSQTYAHLFDQDKALQVLPELPDFPLSLKPDEYELPEIDPSWDSEKCEPQVQTLKEHLKDDEDMAEVE
ncbi:endosomal targeting BRO1-like domain-containing protein isoform X2 [Tasmannia lanceolata]|uniref:endosomal targeting BRO1-like domain-containing protein isoform X2 n=1 Tax=Tasmannia lanceolata TaxID=3420 RepID=UPI0040630A8F